MHDFELLKGEVGPRCPTWTCQPTHENSHANVRTRVAKRKRHGTEVDRDCKRGRRNGICLRAVHGTAPMHPERHSKGMKEQALNRATSCRRLKGNYAFPDRRPKLGRPCTPLCMPSQRISESSSRESGPANHLLVAVCQSAFTVGQRNF